MESPFSRQKAAREAGAAGRYGRRIRRGRYAFLVIVYLVVLSSVARAPFWLLGNAGAWQAVAALAITAVFLYPVWRWASRHEYFYRYD